MSSGKNIANAFVAVRKTYENIYNLLSYIQNETGKRGDFELSTPLPRFLRWKSDGDHRGWLINYFILLFQRKSDVTLENDWRDGPIYALELNLSDYDEPTAILCRFDYKDIKNWAKGYSPSDYWGFHDPIHKEGVVEFAVKNDAEFKGVALGDGTWYWGFKSICGSLMPLTEINADNAFDKIISGFKKLDEQNLIGSDKR